ncbi:YhcG family protein [Fibrobacter sp. HC4]|uniref:PDDEXK nuclease domain-containing protein n=1 Tax=Fibrobacter sp. HC4 TaxID=3239812 RepID=UPI0020198E04|nr:PDDEXK nuclease domain-containing protein [Fibrobacter succinogenes]MCL4101742.1 putative nuclease YhcG [Fibrobacter succinogenes]
MPRENSALKKFDDKLFVKDLGTIVSTARDMSFRAANLMQVACNWLIGWRIVEQEQQGKARAGYGKHVIQLASESLTEKFGKGYSETVIRNFRKFYLMFPNLQVLQILPNKFVEVVDQIQQPMVAKLNDEGSAILPQLSWMHYENLMRVADEKARHWYMQEAASEQWDYRTLKRNIASQYYYRLVQTPKNKKAVVVREMKSLTADYQKEKSQFIKNPMIVEFLGLNQDAAFTETTLENAILNHLQKFLMEMGKGYALVSRQQHIHTEEDDYYIDLVFYNYMLKCFVLVDLKTRKICYEDVGQMDMYLKLYDTHKRSEGDNPTIGVILCSETNGDVAKFSTLATNKRMYAAKYLTYMPSKEVLAREIEMQKDIFEKSQRS